MNKVNKIYRVEGIGQPEVPGNLNYEVIDSWVKVGDKESFIMAREIIKKEGLFIGGSSGSVLVGLFRYLKE